MLSFASLLALLTAVAAAPQVQIGQTTITGKAMPAFGQDFFGGIPFAEPPLGNLRLSPPVLKTQLDTPTFDASNFGPACLQDDLSLHAISEDCLTVNVFRPANLPAGVLLPVMFWIYGGGFEFGASEIYNASAIVGQSLLRGTPVVFVSMNYRLGPLGFPQGQEAANRGALNLALKDQLAALQWVQSNIGAFGGDKTKVTVFGQSAGSISLAVHFLNNDITHLARAAIFESGSAATSLNFPAAHREVDWQNYVKAVPHSVLLQAHITASGQSGEIFPWDPVIDGPGGLFPDIPSKLFKKGHFAKLPFIAGTVLDEATVFTPRNIVTEDQLRAAIIANYTPSPSGARILSADATTLLQLYPDNPALGSPFNTGDQTFGLSSQFKRASALFGDLSFQSQRRAWIQTASNAGVKTFGYLFTDPQQGPPVSGVSHASEVPYVFGAPGLLTGTVPTPSAVQLSGIMVDYWVSFATSLDPNDGKGNPRPLWSQYSASNQVPHHPLLAMLRKTE
ncbi:hypothetical protein ONZ45_g16397 [Pleurotus djamor]|nr:hypothetical protein ONZ45_g16397 [Pleurotus djamor]